MLKRGNLYFDCYGQELEWRKRLSEDIICRADPVEQLLELLGRPKNVVPESVFVYGLHASGKSYVVSRFLNVLQYKHVIVDCLQCYLPSILFGSILKGVLGKDAEQLRNCDNMYGFVNQLQSATSREHLKEDAFIVVLDNCERLRTMDSNILPAFLRLQELTGLNVCCLLISTLPWEKFLTPSALLDPFEIFFPQYTKDEILKIVCHNCKWGGDLDALFGQYVRLFLSVFFICCRDVAEVQHMVKSRFLEHCEPIVSGQVEASRLWATLQPHFRTLGSELYLRVVPSASSTRAVSSGKNLTSHWALSFELPYYSKFFLIAAFLASYIPQKLDKALFVKKSEKKYRKRKNNRTYDDVMADLLVGPQSFSVGRLLAIFYSIIDANVNFTASISAQISSLVKLQLLSVNDSNLDSQALKCTVGLDFITTIANCRLPSWYLFSFPGWLEQMLMRSFAQFWNRLDSLLTSKQEMKMWIRTNKLSVLSGQTNYGRVKGMGDTSKNCAACHPVVLFQTTICTTSHIALSPLGDVVVVAAGSDLHFFIARTGELDRTIGNIYPGPISGVMFDSSGKHVLTAGLRHVRVFHNVAGAREAAAMLRQRLHPSLSSAHLERVRQQLAEAEAFLASVGEPVAN